jgi:hypothetical protein
MINVYFRQEAMIKNQKKIVLLVRRMIKDLREVISER